MQSKPVWSLKMGNASVRQLDEETVTRLQARAASHSVSMEEEVRRILRAAVSAPERLGNLARQLFGPRHGVELQLPERPANPRLEFSGGIELVDPFLARS
jgi:plasmid stability protein